MRSWCAATAVILLIGCSDPAPPSLGAADDPAASVMPSVELRHTSSTIESGPSSLGGRLRVSDNGDVLLSATGISGTTMLVVDSLGHDRYRFGPPGEGPGELRLAIELGVSPTSATVANLSRMQFVTFDTAGQVVRTVQLQNPRALPVTLLGDTAVLSIVPGPAGTLPAVMELPSTRLRMLLDAPDSVTTAFSESARAAGVSPALGIWAHGFVFADPVRYRLALYDWDGSLVRVIARDIPAPRSTAKQAAAALEAWRGSGAGRRASASDLDAKREEFLKATEPHFAHHVPLATDAAGRLWVVGQDGDSAYADVFSPTAFLGRIPLPCRGIDRGIAVSGGWLALACESDDPDYLGDAVLKLFRITEPN